MNTLVLTDYLGRSVRLTDERLQHILQHHPEMTKWIDKIGSVLVQPEQVVRSRFDPESELYYVWQPQTQVGPKYLCVVVVVKEKDAFVLTAYLTDSIKKGQVLWPRKNT